MKQYLKQTWKNKVVSVVMLVVSLAPIWVEGDATALAMLIVPIVYLFFSNEDQIGGAME